MHLENSTKVLGEDAGRETLFDLVVPSHGLIHVLALEYIDNRSKSLVVNNRSIVGQTCDDGWLHEVASSVDGLKIISNFMNVDYSLNSSIKLTDLAAKFNFSSKLDSLINGLFELVNACLAVHGTIQDTSVQGVSDSLDDLLVSLLEPAQHLVVHLLVQNESPGGGAALSGSASAGKYDGSGHHVQVGVFSHQQRIVAAQLEQVLAKAILNLHAHLCARDKKSDFFWGLLWFINLVSNLGAASEGNEWDALVLGHGDANIGTSGAEGAHGAWNVVPLQNLGNYFGGSH